MNRGWCFACALLWCGCNSSTFVPPDPPDATPPKTPVAAIELHELKVERLSAGLTLAARIAFELPRDDVSVRVVTRCESGAGVLGSADLLATRGLRRGQQAALTIPLFQALPLSALPQRCELSFVYAPRPGTGESAGAPSVYCSHRGIAAGPCQKMATEDQAAPLREAVAGAGGIVLTVGPAVTEVVVGKTRQALRASPVGRRILVPAPEQPTTVQAAGATYCLRPQGDLNTGPCAKSPGR